ncbi:hypothetical protein ACE11G_17270 [Gordonia sp. PS3]|uniref:TY-Chap N-terminal domain-containing protein n=1 Tax=Gordonia sihwensis NBRC 108236 TaxID=1223544 RepID=L7LR49_9ACTN|nr:MULTISPECIES: hypothetical protein [Gordonia]AUH67441.1 hypothetical protein CXX93_02570 [Gordonia sp. YC-JH1]KJR09135.1 hypothetical protein UG54_05495 [Gordonia sihwensis]KXT55799.1 hypothetical protein Y710_17255 [Gordonia sp. QH-12]MBY4571849.1 hypothetical protein [Gordonia sihwensis]WFN92916.1 hypothetical protein P5P27_19615 [Gordonia sihwensis]
MDSSSGVFSEAAFDAAIDRVWVRFRCELADQLDRMSHDHPVTVFALWTELFGPQPTVVFTHTLNSRLRLTVAHRDLYPYGPEDRQRVAMLTDRGWRSLRDQTCIVEFARRGVDAAAMAAQYALREVWGVPDPSYLVADQDDVLRTFITSDAAAREPKMR